jgi:hypothetical protein
MLTQPEPTAPTLPTPRSARPAFCRQRALPAAAAAVLALLALAATGWQWRAQARAARDLAHQLQAEQDLHTATRHELAAASAASAALRADLAMRVEELDGERARSSLHTRQTALWRDRCTELEADIAAERTAHTATRQDWQAAEAAWIAERARLPDLTAEELAARELRLATLQQELADCHSGRLAAGAMVRLQALSTHRDVAALAMDTVTGVRPGRDLLLCHGAEPVARGRVASITAHGVVVHLASLAEHLTEILVKEEIFHIVWLP